MNYFVLQLNLCELEEMGQVRRDATMLLGSLYELTEQGRYTLDSFDSTYSRQQTPGPGGRLLRRWKATASGRNSRTRRTPFPMKGGPAVPAPAYAGGGQRIAGSCP